MSTMTTMAPGSGGKESASSEQLINDKTVSQMISMSCSWIRRQRMDFMHGDNPIFAVTPVMIGSSPRYRLADVLAWISSLEEGGAS